MSKRDGYQHGVPCWIDTWQPDAEQAARFYAALFGWAIDGNDAGDGRRHLICSMRDRHVAAIGSPRPAEVPGPSAWGTYIWVDDVEEVVATAIAAGGRAVLEPFDSIDGGRMAVLADPQQALIGVWRPGAHKGAQLVNEFGAWSMSPLRSADPQASAAFYGAVFGWQADPFGPMTMFRLPGFVGGEPLQPVPRDVVAMMAPAEQGEPSGWSVDFWVDDIDATADRAAKLGGKVLAAPYEIPGAGIRQAVLADPQGAGFSVTRVLAIDADA